jgi:hypothetical protein
VASSERRAASDLVSARATASLGLQLALQTCETGLVRRKRRSRCRELRVGSPLQRRPDHESNECRRSDRVGRLVFHLPRAGWGPQPSRVWLARSGEYYALPYCAARKSGSRQVAYYPSCSRCSCGPRCRAAHALAYCPGHSRCSCGPRGLRSPGGVCWSRGSRCSCGASRSRSRCSRTSHEQAAHRTLALPLISVGCNLLATSLEIEKSIKRTRTRGTIEPSTILVEEMDIRCPRGTRSVPEGPLPCTLSCCSGLWWRRTLRRRLRRGSATKCAALQESQKGSAVLGLGSAAPNGWATSHGGKFGLSASCCFRETALTRTLHATQLELSACDGGQKLPELSELDWGPGFFLRKWVDGFLDDYSAVIDPDDYSAVIDPADG